MKLDWWLSTASAHQNQMDEAMMGKNNKTKWWTSTRKIGMVDTENCSDIIALPMRTAKYEKYTILFEQHYYCNTIINTSVYGISVGHCCFSVMQCLTHQPPNDNKKKGSQAITAMSHLTAAAAKRKNKGQITHTSRDADSGSRVEKKGANTHIHAPRQSRSLRSQAPDYDRTIGGRSTRGGKCRPAPSVP